MRVGWIGLGRMGEAFALQILGGGHELIGHVRTERPRPDLTAAGARFTTSLAEAVRDAQVVGVGLFDDGQVQEVLIEGGVLDAMATGAVLCLHTTGEPRVAEAVAEAAPAGVFVLDTTFSGTEESARARQVRLFVGGDAAALERARLVLATYCDPIFHLGAVGAGRRLKLVNNLVFAAQVSLAAEAIGALEAMGVPREAGLEALRLASGGSYAQGSFVGREVEPLLTGLARYLDKDVDAARAAARSEGLELPLLWHAAARWGRQDG